MVEVLAGEKYKGETSKAIQACNDYLRMGPGRSLRVLAASYNDMPQNATPTRSFDTLGTWSGRYSWQARAEEYDTALEARKTAEAEAVMSEGLALPHERVRMLKEMAGDLQPLQIRVGIKRGEEIKIIDPAVVAQLRGTLDDLAKETGGRVSKIESKIEGIIEVEDYREDLQRRISSIAARAGAERIPIKPEPSGG